MLSLNNHNYLQPRLRSLTLFLRKTTESDAQSPKTPHQGQPQDHPLACAAVRKIALRKFHKLNAKTRGALQMQRTAL